MYGARGELLSDEFLADDFEFDGFPDEEGEFDDEFEGLDTEGGSMPFSEEDEMELAAELLEIGDDEELDYFFRGLLKKAGRGLRRFARSRTGRRLIGRLKGMARRSLVRLGRRAGGKLLGADGADLGGRLAAAAGRRFGLELEGLSPEDQEFEVARRFVRFAGAAGQNAARLASRGVAQADRKALATAARRFAPGLMHRRSQSRRQGAWFRKGNHIILRNVF